MPASPWSHPRGALPQELNNTGFRHDHAPGRLRSRQGHGKGYLERRRSLPRPGSRPTQLGRKSFPPESRRGCGRAALRVRSAPSAPRPWNLLRSRTIGPAAKFSTDHISMHQYSGPSPTTTQRTLSIPAMKIASARSKSASCRARSVSPMTPRSCNWVRVCSSMVWPRTRCTMARETPPARSAPKS